MALVPDEFADGVGKAAGWLAAIIVGVVGAAAVTFKRVVGIRRDLREDHAEVRAKHAADTIDDAYRQALAMHNEIIERLSTRVATLEVELSNERQARHTAEEVARITDADLQQTRLELRQLKAEVQMLRARLNGNKEAEV